MSDTPNEIRGLTGIRGIAALMVVVYHFQDTFVRLVPACSVLAPTARVGLLGVDVFFILSGLILCLVYRADESAVTWASHRRFLTLRIARVYPNHVAALVAMGLLVASANRAGVHMDGMFPISQLPFQLTMTHAWFRSPGMEWNYPSWSISSEWFAYLFLFPLGAWYLRRRPGAWVHVALAVVATQAWLHISNTQWPRAIFPTLRILCGFMGGVALYGVLRTAPWLVAMCQRFTTPLLIVFLLAVAVLPALWSHSPELMFLSILGILIGLTSDRSLAARWLGSEPMVRLGRWSYALYMSHAVTGHALEWAVPAMRFENSPMPIRFGILVLYAAVILLAAVLLYHGVEEPARYWLRGLSRRGSRGTAKA
ncbi:MAG: acyltransferase [Candidatus Eisenbacteria bacterium]